MKKICKENVALGIKMTNYNFLPMCEKKIVESAISERIIFENRKSIGFSLYWCICTIAPGKKRYVITLIEDYSRNAMLTCSKTKMKFLVVSKTRYEKLKTNLEEIRKLFVLVEEVNPEILKLKNCWKQKISNIKNKLHTLFNKMELLFI